LERGESLGAEGDSPLRETQRLLSAIPEEGLCVHCAFDRHPLEMTPDGSQHLEDAVAEALKRGATLAYVRPNETALSQAIAMGIVGVPNASEMATVYDEFRARIAARVGRTDARLMTRMKMVAADLNPFFAVGARYYLIRATDLDRAPLVAVVESA